MANILNIKDLMKIDRAKALEVPSKILKAKKLSKLLGENVDIEIKALKGDDYYGLLKLASPNGKGVDMGKMYDVQKLAILDAVTNPCLKDEDLMKHFGAATPKELVEILFDTGEIADIFNEIAALSGFGEDEVEEAKNL